jgi:hypothetical protein
VRVLLQKQPIIFISHGSSRNMLFRSLAIFRRSGSVGARDFRLNLAKSGVPGADVLPNSRSNHPIVSSRTDRDCNIITVNFEVKGTVPLHLFEKLATTPPARCSSNVGKGPIVLQKSAVPTDVFQPFGKADRR